MSAAAWDDVLDELDRTVSLVEAAMAAGEDLPPLPPFVPPADVMPPLSPQQRVRAEALRRRQAALEVDVAAAIVTTTLDLGDARRRRRAAVAYGRR